MKKMRKKELEVNIDKMLLATLGLLQDLHLVHKKTAFEELLVTKIPGLDITVAKLINNLFSIVSPVIGVARRNYPELFAVLDWTEAIVRKLLKA